MTGGTTGDVTQLLLGLCAGLMLAMAAAMLRAPRPTARWTGFAFFFASAAYAIKMWCDETGALPPEAQAVVSVIAISSVGWFWLMVMALFGDRDDFRPVMYLAPAGLAALGLAMNTAPDAALPALVGLGILMHSGLAIASLAVVVRSWNDDLVETRRRVRGPFMAAVALYILSITGFDIWAIVGELPGWYPAVNGAMLIACALAGAFTFMQARSAMFGDIEPAALREADRSSADAGQAAAAHRAGPPVSGARAMGARPLDRAAKADLDRLETLMSRDRVWKEEGLTIASLALRAGMPETQLRRLVSDCLGYRNFPSYVNAHRIAAAKRRLADPDEARVSISTIAYDIGFASLGPFNRAFRQEAGVSPSEWRRRALDIDSPIPEPA
jgi:AraC-like DNA-binding protein